MTGRTDTLRGAAIAGLGAIRDRAERSRRHLAGEDDRAPEPADPEEIVELPQPVDEAQPTAESQEPPEQAAGPVGYAESWNPLTLADAMAQIYNTTDVDAFERGGRSDFDWLQRHLRPEHTALDLGCGVGRVTRYVAEHCSKVWAVDVSPRMLELAQERLSACANVTYTLCHDVTIPAVPSESVDLAYSLLVLQHVEREDAFLLLEELHRVVRPGGTVMLTFPNLLSPTYLECFKDYAHRRATDQVNRARTYTAAEVGCLVRAAGFEEPALEVHTEIGVIARRP